jgi:hypothetical protein
LNLALDNNFLHKRTVLVNNNITNTQVNIGEIITKLVSIFPDRSSLSCSSSVVFFNVSIGSIELQNLLLVHNNYIFIKVEGLSGIIRVIDCDVRRTNLAVSQKQFFTSAVVSQQARIYVENSRFSNLLYREFSVFDVINCRVVSLVNVLVCEGEGLFTGIPAPLFLNAIPTSSSTLEVEFINVTVSNITISHNSHPSKGFISIISTDGEVDVTVSDSYFERVSVDRNTSNGGIFDLVNCNNVLIRDSNFNTSGGALYGGVFSFVTCKSVRVLNSTFNNTYTAVGGSRGGAVYAEVSIISSLVGNKFFVTESSFNRTKAENGRGGGVYVKFIGELESCTPDSDYRTGFYKFSSTTFNESEAMTGTNIFVEAYALETLVTFDTFDVLLTISGVGINEYMGLDTCEGSEGLLKSIVMILRGDVGSEGLILVSSNPDVCFGLEISIRNTCVNLVEALSTPGGIDDSNFIIEIIDSADLNDAVALFGNIVVISPPTSQSYVVLVIGLNGIIYLESGRFLSMNRAANDVEGANLTLTRMDIKLPYKTASVAHPLFVVVVGIVTLSDCLFSSGSSDTRYPNYVSVYIAEVRNNGELMINKSSVSQIEVEGNYLVNAYDESTVEIEVCLCFF